MEVSLKAGLENVLFHLELENEGSPKIKQITGTFYVSSPNSEDELQNLGKVRLNDPLFIKLLTNRSKLISNFRLFFKEVITEMALPNISQQLLLAAGQDQWKYKKQCVISVQGE